MCLFFYLEIRSQPLLLESVVVVFVISERKRDTNTNFWFVFVSINTNRVCVFRTYPLKTQIKKDNDLSMECVPKNTKNRIRC